MIFTHHFSLIVSKCWIQDWGSYFNADVGLGIAGISRKRLIAWPFFLHRVEMSWRNNFIQNRILTWNVRFDFNKVRHETPPTPTSCLGFGRYSLPFNLKYMYTKTWQRSFKESISMVVTICLRQGDDKVWASLDLLRDHVLFILENPQVHFHKYWSVIFSGLKINFITGGELRKRREWIFDELRNRFCTIFETDSWQRTRGHDECVHKMTNIINNYQLRKPYIIHNIA